MNYFYFNFGYESGGTYQTLFTVVYAVATLLGQCLYPLFANKLKMPKMKLFTIASITTLVAYILLFSYVFYTKPETFFIVCIYGFIAFFGQTIMSLILYIMIQDSIDYNEYKYNERRESSTFSLRAFTAKIGSSLQQLALYAFLFMAGLFTISNEIANAEREFMGDKETIIETVNVLMNGITQDQLIIFHIGFTILPFVLFLATFLIIKFKYKISEEKHREMVEAIEKRKAEANINKEENN